MQIRLMRADDIEAVAELERECFMHPWPELVIQDSFVNERYIFVIAEDAGGVRGYGGMYYAGTEGFITNIAVTKLYRRKGIGRQIIEKLIAECRKLKLESLSLEVRISNVEAINLYKKLKFADYGVRPRYYPDGEDARIFLLEVK